MTKLTAILIDDDISIINNFKMIINNYFNIDIELKECFTNGIQALSYLTKFNPDIIFLDIEMPNIDGFELFKLIPQHIQSKVVIISGKESYALKAIKHSAFDFIVKPVSIKDLRNCINKISLQKTKKNQSIKENQLIINRQDKIVFINIFKINCIEASGSYSNIYFDNKMLNSSKNLKKFEFLLNYDNFTKINRSYIINNLFIKEILKYDNDGAIILENGKRIEISRTTKEDLLKIVKIKNKII